MKMYCTVKREALNEDGLNFLIGHIGGIEPKSGLNFFIVDLEVREIMEIIKGAMYEDTIVKVEFEDLIMEIK